MSTSLVSIYINHNTLQARHCFRERLTDRFHEGGRAADAEPGWKHFVSFEPKGCDSADAEIAAAKERGVQHVREYWQELAQDTARQVICDGYLYVVFDAETMADIGGLDHRVKWRKDGAEEVCRLIPQGRVPTYARADFADNVFYAKCLE